MTPEEKLLALIQQDKRQGGSITPQEKLLALLEQDKRKPDAVQAQPVVAPAVVPVAAPIPVPVAVPVAAPTPPQKEAKPLPVVVAAPVPPPVKPVPVVAAPPPEVKKAPLVVLPPAAPPPVKPAPVPAPAVVVPVAVPAAPVVVPVASQPVAAVQSGQPARSTPPSAPQPMLFPTIRVSGMTITNRVLAVVVMLLIVVVFYSVAGTQRGIKDELQRQMSGAGEMSVPPLFISDEPVPGVDVFVEKVSARNFFVPRALEKNREAGSDAAAPVGLTKDFKLVAVSMDATTPSESMAIIKGKVDSKTYFVKMGESVGDTGFILARVLADRVVLKQRKQEFELK